ncbi:hypothetical protein LK994_02330 [Ferruginibacter lapsinanis]|uniref:hypothetical protein n=1 Tax=Ferruginibacter lapsinanis TaxID=563172 RepID=UPI001E558409|nr:hypothetical protein [Ferruginibacter lapsinanis]UEG50311.1 hypothetical protein LK994_02330 [Ferruginibacter lapsinanis]
MKDLIDAIRIKTMQAQAEQDPVKKQETNKQLQILRLKKEIEDIRKRIEQLS